MALWRERTTRRPHAVTRLALVGVALVLLLGGATACQPPPPPPVLLVGGTFGPVSYMDAARSALAAKGYNVQAMQLSGNPAGTADITTSAAAVCAKVDAMRTETGAATIDVVAHSQGALAVRYCIKSLGGAAKVHTMVSLGGVNYGSSRAQICQSAACVQMRPGSAFLTTLNEGDDTPGSVRYVHVFSYEANGGTPGEDITLKDGATNVAAQDVCPGAQVVHLSEYDDAIMRQLIDHALKSEPLTATCP